MSRAQLERAVAAGSLILLDTSTIAAYFGDESTTEASAAVIDSFVRSGRNRALVSSVSVTELLVRPIRGGRRDVVSSMLAFMRMFPNLELASVDLSIAAAAADLRAHHGMKAPDALIAATGLDRAAAVAISDDAGWPDPLTHLGAQMQVVALRSLIPL